MRELNKFYFGLMLSETEEVAASWYARVGPMRFTHSAKGELCNPEEIAFPEVTEGCYKVHSVGIFLTKDAQKPSHLVATEHGHVLKQGDRLIVPKGAIVTQ